MHPSGDEDGSLCLALGQRAARETCAYRPGLQYQWDDLVSDGTFGALDARKRFDPTFGVEFCAYGLLRAHYEIIDGMRRRSVLSRHDRSSLGLSPDTAPPARQEPIRFDDWEGRRARGLYAPDWQAMIPIQREAPDFDAAEARIAVPQLLRALQRHSPRHAYVLREHYLRGRTLLNIAGEFGVTESRVSQITTEAFGKLRLLVLRT